MNSPRVVISTSGPLSWTAERVDGKLFIAFGGGMAPVILADGESLVIRVASIDSQWAVWAEVRTTCASPR